MPYGPGQKPVPDYVPADLREQWAARWNSAWEQCRMDDGEAAECEERAFRIANALLDEEEETMSARMITYFTAIHANAWLRVLPLGVFERFGRKVDITHEKISEMAANFGRVPDYVIALNKEHEHSTGRIGDVVAAQARADGLYIRFGNFINGGEEDLTSGAFRYLSPEIQWGPTDYDGQKVSNVLVGVALTNMPYFGKRTALYTLMENEEGAHNEDEQYGLENIEGFAAWTRAFINRLPDSAFLWIENEPDKEKDEEGLTTPRGLRRFPIRNPQGEIDLPHLRNAIGRIPQATYRGKSRRGRPLPRALIERLQNEAREILARVTEESSIGGNDTMENIEEKASPALIEAIGNSIANVVNRFRVGEPQPEPEQVGVDETPSAPEQVSTEEFRALADEHKALREEYNTLIAENEHRARVESYSALSAFEPGLPELLASHPNQEVAETIANGLRDGLEKLKATENQAEYMQQLLGIVGVDGHGEGDADPVEEFTTAVDAVRVEHPALSYAEAVKRAAAEHPELYAAYQECRPTQRHSGGE